MAANDYVFVPGLFNVFLAKKKKPSKNGPQIMSQDRRQVSESEIIGCFEFYLRQYCEEHHTDTIVQHY